MAERTNEARIQERMSPWGHYWACLVFHMIFPFIPILVEYFVANEVSELSMTLATAMYSIAIGTSSRSMSLFSMSLCIGFIFTSLFGMLEYQKSIPPALLGQIPSKRPPMIPNYGILAFFSSLLIFVSHAIERYRRHVVDRNRFIEF
jgi:hypothetical protein